jgi:hypothetical protein
MEEDKEAEKAETDNLIAEAKEDFGATEAQLIEDKTYLKNLNKMCSEGDADFEKRKASRLEEVKAVTELMEDKSRKTSVEKFYEKWAEACSLLVLSCSLVLVRTVDEPCCPGRLEPHFDKPTSRSSNCARSRSSTSFCALRSDAFSKLIQ